MSFPGVNEAAAGAAQYRHERDLLADALGRVLEASGVTIEQPLTGPQLLLLADDLIGHLKGQPTKPTLVPLDETWPTHCGQPMWFRGGDVQQFYCDCGHTRAPEPHEVRQVTP